MREVLDPVEVALVVRALERQDPHSEGAAPAGELLDRIRAAQVVDQPPFQHVDVDEEVAAVLVGALNVIDGEGDATEGLLRLRGRARDLIETVTVVYSRGEVRLRKSSRDRLLDEISALGSAAGVRAAFANDAAPVRLASSDAKSVVVEAIETWMQNIGRDRLPPGVFDLRNALIDDLHDTAGGP